MKYFTAHCTAAILLMSMSAMAFADKDEHKHVDQHKSPQQTATAVPEPEVYGMMLAGLGIVGFATRRKFKVKAVKA